MKEGTTNTTLAEDSDVTGAAGGWMTAYVITYTYRAPEIERRVQQLHDSNCSPHERFTQQLHYGQPVDIWSVGIVFSELLSCACGAHGRGVRHLFDSKLQRTRGIPSLTAGTCCAASSRITSPSPRVHRPALQGHGGL